jgi:phosphodiesterase/alkaline phosphatase D-like protein
MATRRQARVGRSASGRFFRRGVLVAALALALASTGCVDETETAEVVLDYGPILRGVDARSARFLFHAARPDGSEVPWQAGIEISRSPDLDRDTLLPAPVVEVAEATGFVAHLIVEGLEPQTRYTYVPLIDGRRAFDGGSGAFPSFMTAPALGERNADFTTVFLADQHPPNGPETTAMPAYEAAARARPLFWAQLGDVVSGSLREGDAEYARTDEDHRELWKRSYGDRDSPQARFAGSFPLHLATVSDHELANNFSMNWHRSNLGSGDSATLHQRVDMYDRSMTPWWDYFGWGVPLDDRLGRAALDDHGESVMSEPPARLIDDTAERRACVGDEQAARFGPASFVYLVDDTGEAFHTRVASVGSPRDCGDGRGTTLTLEDRPARPYRRDRDARIAVGARYARHGHYHAYRPFPFVEFFLLDTTSYRGDPYQRREQYARDANRDTDHSRYPWNPRDGRMFVFGDREHGANHTTDGVRSWLGPTQKRAFLDAIAGSRAETLVVAAGYPLYSAKFEWSRRYWEARESGFDFAAEVEEIVSALERLGKLVLWVHGDGHTPMLVRLSRNLYQLQVGPTLMRHTAKPGHRSRTLAAGERSDRDSLGGGTLIAGHQPDLSLGDESEDIFGEHLDQFEGFLQLYFHPGREALRNCEQAGLRRGASDRVVEIPVAADPAGANAGRHIVGKVVRLHFGESRLHSVVHSYGFDGDRVRLELADPIVTTDPDRLRVLVDGNPWVEARWFDSRGREWRDFSAVLRREAESVR